MKMAASELNNRLDYLISYSSQLVFVCSDKIQQQSKVVESFLAQQNEQADLALLTANELTPLVIYREKLFRQLISQSQSANFNLPLNQLLVTLNNHDGPVLISIFQAEKLPNKLVKELWDLVLQSRFANNKQHLNVLLMGLSDWAESAKSGLGAKSKDQPIVLNNQSDIQHTETHGHSDLESFIQDKRKKFAQRIENRHHQPYVSQSIYKKWWVATLFGLVFLTTFAGILGWQYPGKVSAIMSYIGVQISTKTQPVEPVDVVKLTETVSIKLAQSATQIIEKSALQTRIPITKKASTKNILVTDWRSASAKIEEQTNKVLLQTNNIDKQPKLNSLPSQPAVIEVYETNVGIVNDYQVEVEAEAEIEYKIENKSNIELVAKPKELQLDNVEQVRTNVFIYSDVDMLLALPSGTFVIQIAAMADIEILQDYINDKQLSQQVWLYKTQRYAGDWYVLLKNQYFPTIEIARAEIINLTDGMLGNTPFVKSIRQVKQEISVSVP